MAKNKWGYLRERLEARFAPRCVGHCCRRFFIESEAAADSPEDEARIADMVIPIGHNHDGKRLFTCRHLHRGRHCTIYMKRPRMCRRYGEEYPCDIPRCPLNTKNAGWLKRLWLALTEPRFRLPATRIRTDPW